MSFKILMIDDDEQLVSLVKSRLELNSYQFISANNGQDGLARARTEKPHLIILDIMMPNMDGGQVARLLKEDMRTENIPILFMTSMVSREEEFQSQMQLNIDNRYHRAISKPFDAKDLLEKVKECLSVK